MGLEGEACPHVTTNRLLLAVECLLLCSEEGWCVRDLLLFLKDLSEEGKDLEAQYGTQQRTIEYADDLVGNKKKLLAAEQGVLLDCHQWPAHWPDVELQLQVEVQVQVQVEMEVWR